MGKYIKFVFFLCLFLNLVFVWTQALTLETEDQEVLKLIVGQTQLLSTQLPTRVVIGNPAVADIVDVTDSEITLSGKSAGQTTLVYWDIFGEQSVKIKVFAEDLSLLKQRIDVILDKMGLPEVYTQAEEDEAKVLILGRVKYPEDKERIKVVLSALRDKTLDLVVVKEEESVVEIDVQVLELSADATRTLGFTMPGSISVSEPSYRLSKTMRGAMDALFHVFDWPREDFTARLDALAQEGKARILSRPRLSCQSGKEAKLFVGGEKPIFETFTTEVSTGTTVEYKEYGIKLDIKPVVTEARRIKVALNVEVSEVEAAETLGTLARAYPLKKRTASTEVFLDNGQTLAIGGLMKQKAEEDIRKTAGLGDIPIVGMLFRKKTTKLGGGQGERGDTELFITLTPSIVSPRGLGEIPAIKRRLRVETTAPDTTGMSPDLANYIKAVQTKIVGSIYYPPSAKDAGWEGSVKLNLHLSSNGTLKGIKILESSSYKILDNAALNAAKQQAPYSPFPPQIESQELWVDIPIVFKRD